MDKCREAFEAKYKESHPDDKSKMMPNGNYSGWIKQVYWESWQSKQAEIDRLNSVLDERTKEWLEAIELGKYFENVAKPLKAELDEKDKRIQKATAKWISITSILTTTDAGVPDVIFKQLDELHDALIGIEEFEESLRGDNV